MSSEMIFWEVRSSHIMDYEEFFAYDAANERALWLTNHFGSIPGFYVLLDRVVRETLYKKEGPDPIINQAFPPPPLINPNVLGLAPQWIMHDQIWSGNTTA